MNFTPNELQNVMFRRTLIGFHQNQVYELIQKVVEDYAVYIKDNAKLRDKTEEMNERLQYYKGIETSLQNSLLVAQQTSEDVVSSAKGKAENIISEANVRALEIVNEANRQVSALVYERERLERELEAFRIRAESLLQAQITLMKGFKDDEPERKRESGVKREHLTVVGK